jgi:mannosyltransferase OCH1-like enzyme
MNNNINKKHFLYLYAMPIPKIIFQTWKTKQLHPNVEKIRNDIQQLNPEYTMVLYDDDDMDVFIKNNFSPQIYKCYSQLAVGAAKADFWRYCILYLNGGVYLDIDSDILKPLRELIRDDDQCIITRENNPRIFNNWIMIFEKNHPILLNTIFNCCYNIENKRTNNIIYLTGPAGPFTDAINNTMLPFYTRRTHLYFENDDIVNPILNNVNNNVRCRFYGIDMGKFAKWKHNACSDLYDGHIHWLGEKKIFIDK